MHKRPLGKTEVRLSEIALGTWGLASDAYGRTDEARFAEVVEKALEVGVTTIDMAPLWGDGGAERIVAKCVGKRRGEVQYLTRVGASWKGDAIERAITKESIIASCEASLERLGTDRIDLLLLHEPAESIWRKPETKPTGGAEQEPSETTAKPESEQASSSPAPDAEAEPSEKKPEPPDAWREAIETLRKDGKVLSWGASVSSADGARMAASGGVDALCMTYNMLASDDLHDVATELSTAGCGVLARSPLSHGLLAGRWAEYRSFPRPDHRRDRWSTESLRSRVRQVHRLRYLVHDEVTSLAEAALRYVLANALVTTAIVGARTPAHIESAAVASNGPPYLPDEDLAKVPQILAATGA